MFSEKSFGCGVFLVCLLLDFDVGCRWNSQKTQPRLSCISKIGPITPFLTYFKNFEILKIALQVELYLVTSRF